jgi:hypothetical protein
MCQRIVKITWFSIKNTYATLVVNQPNPRGIRYGVQASAFLLRRAYP